MKSRVLLRSLPAIFPVALVGFIAESSSAESLPPIGQELAVPRHLSDGEEFEIPLKKLLDHGKLLFSANWTAQEGGGRPLTKGTGAPLSDPDSPLVFPRNFNRISAPDANSCAGCHNFPGPGGAGDIVANVFVLGQRFDSVSFDPGDLTPTRGTMDEGGLLSLLDTVGNSRATLGMYGSGFIEMVSRQMTADLQAIRDAIAPGGSAALTSKGVSFGTLARRGDGSWDTAGVEGIPLPSLGGELPNLVIRPFHQAGNVVSLRQFSNNAFNHHHGIQPSERFGDAADPDGDGFSDEMTRADVTAVTLFQATLEIPGRVIPNHPVIEKAVLRGEKAFVAARCADCHVPSLPLTDGGWVFSEPNPYNPAGNARPGDVPTFEVDLTRGDLPLPRPRLNGDRVEVRAYTDLKLHDITNGPDDPNREVLDMNSAVGSENFFAGNGKFLTRKLWDCGKKPNYFHHGKYSTLREAIEAHAGEASESAAAYRALPAHDQDCLIEFLKTLQVLPAGSRSDVIDEHGRPKVWPPRSPERPRPSRPLAGRESGRKKVTRN